MQNCKLFSEILASGAKNVACRTTVNFLPQKRGVLHGVTLFEFTSSSFYKTTLEDTKPVIAKTVQ